MAKITGERTKIKKREITLFGSESAVGEGEENSVASRGQPSTHGTSVLRPVIGRTPVFTAWSDWPMCTVW